MLEVPERLLSEHALRFSFNASNNQAEYEAIIAILTLAWGMEVKKVIVHNHPWLVVNQINNEYEAKDKQLINYQSSPGRLIRNFENV